MNNSIFSDRIHDVPRSFIRDILKVAVSDDIISFAGGLPNRDLFPVDEIREATLKVIDTNGKNAMQYAQSEGYLPLRQYIKDWYRKKKNLHIEVKNILITSGSQQGLDLVGKIFLNDGEGVVMEAPGYLGAIQAFSMYRPSFLPVNLLDDGIDILKLEEVLESSNPKLFYMVPNFQNPAGVSYSLEKRLKIAELVKHRKIILIEDDPYGELRFSDGPIVGFGELAPGQTIMLGTFSKTVAPAFRIGWMVAPDDIMDRLIIAKQAADLHTNSFSQMMLYEYLTMFDPDNHIKKITEVYGRQAKAMIKAINTYFPDDIQCTRPAGGMFLWASLPENLSSMKLFNLAIKRQVAFVPGHPFYVDREDSNSLRLNFSCVDEMTIDIGIKRLVASIEELVSISEHNRR